MCHPKYNMRVTDIFPPEVIDEDIKSMMRGAALGASILASPLSMDMATPKKIEQPAATPEPPRDLIVLAQTIWGEARSHGVQGMDAVGHVILNRATNPNKRLFGDGIEGVSKKPYQFSAWLDNDPNSTKMEEIVILDKEIQKGNIPGGKSYEEFMKTKQGIEYAAWLKAKKVAAAILSGESKDPTNGALFYHTTAVTPKWSKRMTPIGQVKNHVFYRGVDKK